MNISFSLTIPQDFVHRIETQLQRTLEPARQAAQNAMADTFLQHVHANFGSVGLDRPSEWPMLSPKYAKKVHREYATLYVSGALKEAVKVNYGVTESSVSVSKQDVPYALIHQFGGQAGKGGSAHIPARPYFPIDANGSITEYTRQECIQAAKLQFSTEVNRGK